jgi:hypothetical protein
MVRYGTLATRFGDQSRIRYSHLMAYRFDHVIDRQGGDGRTRQSLHLYSRLVRDSTCAINNHLVSLQANVDFDLIQGQWMAEWNQVTCFSDREMNRGRKSCDHEHRHLLLRYIRSTANELVLLTWQP